MHITVIGHLCKDVVHRSNGSLQREEQQTEYFGGIFFSVAALGAMASDEDTIHPVFGVSESDHEALLNQLRKYPNVETGGIFTFQEPTNSVHLFYDMAQARVECSKNISQPVPFTRIKPYLDTDALLINMISGFDITLETLDAIRMQIRDRRIPIHFDFHSLTLGIDRDFKRFRRPLTDWRRWCFMLNSIQLSEEEALGLSAERYNEPALINQLMPLMVNALVITRGSRGATVIVQDVHKKLTLSEIPGIPLDGAVDPTGCGDVFGATFLYYSLKTKDFVLAARSANEVAAVNATVTGPDKFDILAAKSRPAQIPFEARRER